MHAAVVELDALTDTVRPATQHHDLLAAGGIGLALFLIGGVHVGGVGGELGGAGIHPLVHREHVQLVTLGTQILLAHAQQLGQAGIGEALALETVHQITIDIGQTHLADALLILDQVLDLHQEPGVDLGQLEDTLDTHARTEGITDIPDALGTGHGQLARQSSGSITVVQVQLRIKPAGAHFQPAQGLLQGLLERPADGHDLAHGLHLSGQTGVGVGEFLEGETRDLGHHVVDGRLEGGRGTTAGDVVAQLIQGVTDGQLGGDLGDRETGSLGSQRRGARHPRVHFDDHHAAIHRVDAELHVGATGFHPDLTQHRQRGVAHDLVFLVGQGLRRSHGDGVTGVHPHGIEVLDRADDDAVVLFVADHLHLVFLPADQRLVDQQLLGRRQVQTTGADFLELFTVVGNTTTGAAHGEGRADDAGEADLVQYAVGLVHIMGDAGARAFQTDVSHGLVETRTVFGLVDGVGVGTDHFHTELLQHTVAFQLQRAVQRSLAAHGRQQGVGALLLDDARHRLPFDRLDVGGVGHGRVGHDGGRVGVDQDDPETFLTQRLAGLGAGIVELAGLTDDDGAGAEDQDTLDISTFWHSVQLTLGVRRLRRVCSWQQ